MKLAVSWSNIHVGFKPNGKRLFIGRGEVVEDKIKWNSISEDRTLEIVTAVAAKMKSHLDLNNDDKPYFGYNIKGYGKLVLIRDGFKFDYRPEPRKRQ